MEFFDVLSPKRSKCDIVKKISSIPSNYVGSKRRMLHYIWDVIEQNHIEFDSVFDAFSGSAMVSLLFKLMGKKVFCNDLLTSSAITAVCLLENNDIPISKKELVYLCKKIPKNYGTFVLDNYKNKFFTERECIFLDRYKKNVEDLFGNKFYCGMELLNKATLSSIPNSNFSVYGKNLEQLRSTHTVGESFWNEKWRDTTRKRRDANNEIMFDKSLEEMRSKYKSAFSIFAIENHVNQYCFLGGRYYNGQTIADIEHRLCHDKIKGREINDVPLSVEKFKRVLSPGTTCVFNSDIIDLLKSDLLEADLLYLDPPYGGASSDYAVLYRFLEEYLYECKLEEMEHIQRGGKRFSNHKGYQEQLEELLSLCGKFKVWLLSYNESSYADLDIITSTIKNAGRSNIKVFDIPVTYQYRKWKCAVSGKEFKKNYEDKGKSHLQRGTEYLILAMK